MDNPLLGKLRKDEAALGISLALESPGSLELMGKDWDWVLVACSEGDADYKKVLNAAQVAALHNVPMLVKLPNADTGAIGKTLDTGALGLVIPGVETAEQARKVVTAACFPPMGQRSYGGRRVVDILGREYYSTANDDILIILQIDRLETVGRSAELAQVQGVDGLLFWPDVMLDSAGIPLRIDPEDAPEILKSLEMMTKAARRAGKIAGCLTTTPSLLKEAVSLGCRLVVPATDALMLKTGARDTIDELRSALHDM